MRPCFTHAVVVIGVCCLGFGAALGAEQLASLDYTIQHPTQDAGGGRSSSSEYAADFSLGGFGGIIADSAGQFLNRTGWAGQLNDPPIARADVVQRLPGKSVKVSVTQLLANDLDPEGEALVVTAVGAPSITGASITVSGRWIFYEPPAGAVGNDSFTYTVIDSLGQPSTGTVVVLAQSPIDASPNHRVVLLRPGYLRLSFAGIPGRLYRIEYTGTLNPPLTLWTPLTTLRADALGSYGFEDTLPEGVSQRFYRSVEP